MAIRILVLIIILSTPAWAAPSIESVSGTYTAGQTITVSGSEFGSKTNAAPYHWDNFDSGTNGNNLGAPSALSSDTSNWQIASSGGSTYPVYSNTRAHSGSLSVYSDLASQYNCGFGVSWGGIQSAVYFSWWQYYSTTGSWTNYKPWRQHGNNNLVPQMDTVCEETGCFGALIDSAGTSLSNLYGIFSSTRPPDGAWQHWEVLISSGTAGGSNGYYYVWVDGDLRKAETGIPLLTAGTSYGFDALRIQNYFDGGAGDLYVWSDDAYVDNAISRVFLSDANDLDSSWPDTAANHSEIQIPATWSDTSLTFTLNQGTFGDTDTVYVYVVNSSNAISSGYEITLSGSGSSPSTPTPTISGCVQSGGVTR